MSFLSLDLESAWEAAATRLGGHARMRVVGPAGAREAESPTDRDQNRMEPIFQAEMYRLSGEFNAVARSQAAETARPASQRLGSTGLVPYQNRRRVLLAVGDQ